jgi:hypothetical protein
LLRFRKSTDSNNQYEVIAVDTDSGDYEYIFRVEFDAWEYRFIKGIIQ